MREMDISYTKILLCFILVLGLVAICIWTIFLIQLSQLVQQSNIHQKEHIHDSLEAKENLVESKQNTQLNIEITKMNSKNIEDILGNITEINQKLDNKTNKIIK